MALLNDKQNFEVDADLASKIQGHLDKVPDPTKEDFDDIPQRKEKDDDVKDDDVKDDDNLDKGDDLDKDDELDDEDVDKDKDKPVLPENYFRAAVHSDWTPEEIQEFFDANPEKALKTFKKIYDSTNAVTQQFVEFGRLSQKQTQDALAAEQAKKDAEKNEFKGMDMDVVEKQFGEDSPAAVALLKASNEQNKALHEQVVELRKSRKQFTDTGLSDEDAKIWHDVESFFNDKDLEVYSEFYGKPEKDKPWNQVLTGEQMQHRHTVIVMADQIKAGAALQGKEMDRGEALRRAHLAASDSIRDVIVRNDLKGKLKKRSKGITVKSTGRRSKADDETSEKRSEKRAEKRAGSRLGKLFGRSH